MTPNDRPSFIRALAGLMLAYDKPLPAKEVTDAWFSQLSEFDAKVVAQAFDRYRIENPKFAPTIVSIETICRVNDGRPGVEEAWAIAIAAQDETETVVWTWECGEAFRICKPVLDADGEVAARMAFKDAYNRLVMEARLERRPPKWIVCQGWDMRKREAALRKAVLAGLLPAPTAAALLPPPEPTEDDLSKDDQARGNLAQIKQMIADAAVERDRKRDAAAEKRIADEWFEKAMLQSRVDAYMAEKGGA